MAKKKRKSSRAKPKRAKSSSSRQPAAMPAGKDFKAGSDMVRVGHYAFFIGLLLAVITGLFRNLIPEEVLFTILVFLGVIVGLLNVTMDETTEFLVASVALMLAGVVNLGLIPVVGVYLRSMLTNIVVFVVPASVLVALRAIWVLANRR